MQLQYYLQSTILVASLASASVLEIRADSWQNKNGGQVDVGVSKDSINWGSFIPKDALGSILAECDKLGNCRSPWTRDTKVVYKSNINGGEPRLVDAKLVFEAEDAAFLDGEKEKMVEVLKHTFTVAQSVKKEKFWPTPKPTCGNRNPDCDPVRQPKKEIDQWDAPDLFTVIHRANKENQAAIISQLRIKVKVELPKDTEGLPGKDICGAVLGSAGGIAGAISGALGAIFAIASLTCLAA
ncbi:hypothetical protein B0J14DRAFT_651963 [Halenospora varia]|nr:hypothetical protein B0J14DRAFT_651963 [Halenospora varia]